MEKTATFVPGSNETCEICVAVMTYLKNLLADNGTKVPYLIAVTVDSQFCTFSFLKETEARAM